MEALSSTATAMTAPVSLSDNMNNGCSQSRFYVSCQVDGPWTLPETHFSCAVLSEVNRVAFVT
jgi:hypothetical protein